MKTHPMDALSAGRAMRTSGIAGATFDMIGSIADTTDAATAAVREWWTTRAAAQRLHAMDDRMLADIGLTRADIDRAVRKGR